jgi:tetratricopeptide (TPR) repeat protein
MNPNLMNNITQEQINNISPEMMRNASSMLNSMSDEQLKLYLNQMGMTNIDPSMFRNMTNSMGNMNDSQFNQMKNMSKNYFNNNNIDNNNKLISNFNDIKNEGNKLFKENKFQDAIKKYYECIEEIKTCNEDDKNKLYVQLNEIEKACRLNIANCKLKTEDYDGVINECSIVLEKNKCFKAYYRMGIALLKKGKIEKAFRFLDNANAIGNAEEKKAIEPYMKECKSEMEKIKNMKKKEKNNNQNEKDIKNKEDVKDNNNNNKENNKNINENEINTSSNNPSLLNNNNNDKKENEDDIKIEDVKNTQEIKTSTNNNNFTHSHTFPSPNFNLNESQMNQARNQINNMSDDQLNSLCAQMKNMDNETLKSLMRAQGMNCTDEQISMMKSSLNPETFKLLKNSNFNMPKHSNTINDPSNINNNNNPANQLPNLANMDIKGMMDFLKKNPEMLKMLSPQINAMLGKDANPEIMMQAMEKILWIFEIPGRLKRFFTSWRGICVIILFITLIWGYFKK